MVATTEIAPTLSLAPFITRYVFREFDTNGIDIFKPWVASYEMSIDFFFKALPVKLINLITGEIIKAGKPCDIVGMSSQYNGEMHFNGTYSFFQIMLKPNAFYQLFNIPSGEIINKITCGEDIFSTAIKLLHEQLFLAKSPAQMAAMADAFLLCYLNKHNPISNKAISHAVHLVMKHAGFIHINLLAQNVNMSVRNFERLFNLVTGMPPKLLCSITRFNKALELKLQQPKMIWTSVAQQAGYFDQMHLIKDFKRFSGNTPKDLLKDTFLFDENLTTI